MVLATDGSKDVALASRAAVNLCEGAGLHVVHAWRLIPALYALPPDLS